MSVTIVPTPPNPVVSKGAKLNFSLSAGGNYVRLWCTDAPLGSKLKTELASIDTDFPRLEIFAGESISSSPPFLFQPDKPGRYQIVAQEYQRGASSYGGGYSGDPNGFNSEQKRGGEANLTIDFGTKVTAQLGVSPDIATLALYIFGESVQATTFELHGESSPAVVDPKTPTARNAATQLQTSALALAGQTATTILGNVDAMVDSMLAAFTFHFGNTTGGIHNVADPYNAIGTAFGNPAGKKATVAAVNELLTCYRLHVTTDQARRTPYVSSGQGSGDWHDLGGGSLVDGTNLPIVSAPTDMAGAYVALADLYDCYSLHQINTSVHGAPDTTDNLTAIPPLMALHGAFLNLIRGRAPAAAPTENPGVPVLVGGAGFKES